MTKMTNVMALNAVLEMALADDVREKITSIRDSYVKKSQYKSDKPTKAQEQNVVLRDAIVEYLEGSDEKHTIAEIIKNVPALAEIDATSQKVSPILKALVTDGIVGREDIKRKAHFFFVR